jgi:hypothetical protein
LPTQINEIMKNTMLSKFAISLYLLFTTFDIRRERRLKHAGDLSGEDANFEIFNIFNTTISNSVSPNPQIRAIISPNDNKRFYNLLLIS